MTIESRLNIILLDMVHRHITNGEPLASSFLEAGVLYEVVEKDRGNDYTLWSVYELNGSPHCKAHLRLGR